MSWRTNLATQYGRHAASCVCAAAIWLLLGGAAEACPMCKEAIASQQGGGDLKSGFFYSILFMLSMPFTIFGSMSGYFYWQGKKGKAAKALQEQPKA